MNKIIVATLGLIVACTGIIIWQTSKNHDDSSMIIVGTNAEYAPFSSIEQGEIVGFDIDIAKNVCERIGKPMKLVDMSFDMLLPKLQVGSLHLIAAGLTATPERARKVAFTKPYLEGDPLVIISNSTDAPLTTMQNLVGRTVVVNEGYTADVYVSEHKDIHVKRLAAPAEGFLALQSGRADAFVAAYSSVKPFFEQHGLSGYVVTPIPGTAENCALAVSQRHRELLPAIQQALDAMQEDGTITRLKKKWGLT